jgi:hypothetical protein
MPLIHVIVKAYVTICQVLGLSDTSDSQTRDATHVFARVIVTITYF